MEDANKLQRIVEARMKLKARFQASMHNTPSMNDERPMGTGPLNRHGMPQLPIGQTISNKWPVLDIGHHPHISLTEWRLELVGAVAQPVSLNWQEFMELPQAEDHSDFHCVTTWSRLNMRWKGVRFIDLASLVQPLDEASHIMCYASDDYSTNLSLVEALKADVLLVHTIDEKPLPIEHGGPVRMITPQLYAWKGSKWINRIEFMTANRPGFWEERGYSNTAYPWRNDRYS